MSCRAYRLSSWSLHDFCLPWLILSIQRIRVCPRGRVFCWVHCGQRCAVPGPSRATAGPGKTLPRVLSHPPHSVCLEIETPKASRGRKRGERCSLTIRLEVWGASNSSPSGVPENGFYAYFRSERSHLEHHLQHFWATAGPPKRPGPGKTFPPFPPSRRACSVLPSVIFFTVRVHTSLVEIVL